MTDERAWEKVELTPAGLPALAADELELAQVDGVAVRAHAALAARGRGLLRITTHRCALAARARTVRVIHHSLCALFIVGR